MVSGFLTEKKGYYYIVLNLKDKFGKRKPKWIPTGLTVKGNKRRADEMLAIERQKYTEIVAEEEDKPKGAEMLFADYMLNWLDVVRTSIKESTYAGYAMNVNAIIEPYFRKLNIKLKELNETHIQEFYTEQLKRVKASTVVHYHSVIHKALKKAVKISLIPYNPVDRVERPKPEEFTGSFYSVEEVTTLMKAANNTRIEFAILFGTLYGLRRSEVVGLRWSSVDFVNHTITIEHTVTSYMLDHKRITKASNTTKNKSSRRTLPLLPVVEYYLLNLKESQQNNRKLCGKSYSLEYLDYMYIDEVGERIKPDYITQTFPKLLDKCGLRRARFHDLRHTCASLLLAFGVPMKEIQEWLGHSDFNTTADIYTHLEYVSKVTAANSMVTGLKLGNLLTLPNYQNKEAPEISETAGDIKF